MMIIEIYMNILITFKYHHRFAKWDNEQPESHLKID